ncbi:uncharacterized protein SPPG_06853 [Spizellomyces punctatus DAOM BR117]|uniref:Uncharacterized protein n=1 Tax=Spizellomyces punctatus (strain DAOM BR117) TaxID=645134 RepID=A0A0L0H9I6_SPIPD|nr:uncharacterized protein SPPG_06853 [Spizellomyces punctatus DAOM BR117]KNC97857.1 hypothetical protein SPPG_06853 [Spizellomyces punctatus DAOM BR117]|eukprot:XP_016605897.1 hypothetical protein SPPG_06853 [Spizellomyces punctatus DAOM BR117]
MTSVDALASTFQKVLQISESGHVEQLMQALPDLIPHDDDTRAFLAEREDIISFLQRLLDTAATNSNTADVPKYKKLGAVVAQLIAEAAKVEDTRDPIADAGTIPTLIQLLKIGNAPMGKGVQGDTLDDDLVVQSLRALANLCYDHDGNRERVLEVQDGIPEIVACLNSPSKRVMITTCGALTNITMDNEPVQIEALNAHVLSPLLKALQGNIDEPFEQGVKGAVSTAVIRVMSNLLETETGIQELLAADGLSLLLRLLKYKHDKVLHHTSAGTRYESAVEVLDALTTVLESIGENDTIQRAIVSQDLLDILLDFVDRRPEGVAVAKTGEDLATYTEIRKTVSRIVTLVTMNDANMVDLPKKREIIDRFKQWMTNGFAPLDTAEEDEIRMSGALCIGNLARSDETCVSLVQEHDVARALLNLLALEVSRVKQSGTELKSTVKVLHAVMGSLKNLSLAAANRPIMGAMGVIPKVADLLEIPNIKPVQYGATGVLKNLCSGDNEANVYRIISGQEPPGGINLSQCSVPSAGPKTPLGKVITLVWTATGDNDTGIRNEGGRLLVNLIRACHRGRAPHLLKTIVDANAIPPLIQIITGALLTRSRTSSDEGTDVPEDEHHVHFDAMPLEGQVFPMVQNEGIVALILVADAYPEAIPRITRYSASLIPTLIDILRSGIQGIETAKDAQEYEYADEAKANVCVLLQSLISRDDDFAKRLQQTALKEILTSLHKSSKAHPSVPHPAPPTLPAHPRSPPMDIGRTGTKSARNLASQGPTRSELLASFGSGRQVAVDEGLGLREAVGNLLLGL